MDFFDRFFEEKELDNVNYTIEHNGNMHMIDTETVISKIEHCPEDERNEIEQVLRRLDFKNQPIQPFIKHFAEGFVKTNF